MRDLKLVESETPFIIDVGSSGDLQGAVDHGANILLSGGVVAFPTETFYGLAVDIRNDAAIRRLFAVKQRRSNRPILILIDAVEALEPYVDHIPPVARSLMDQFWPGGLTLIFRAGPAISPLLTGNTDKIGIRLSSHPMAAALAGAIGAPISGTSANISDQPACRTAGQVLKSLGQDIDLILDGGRTPGEAGSTILDVTEHPLPILREGVITKTDLQAASFEIV
jgi:L-threonylcarbamoyladenylate synthase